MISRTGQVDGDVGRISVGKGDWRLTRNIDVCEQAKGDISVCGVDRHDESGAQVGNLAAELVLPFEVVRKLVMLRRHALGEDRVVLRMRLADAHAVAVRLELLVRVLANRFEYSIARLGAMRVSFDERLR